MQAVREMASGLSLPEVGVNPDFCSGLVNEALRLVDSMVTRRVHQKFYYLRVNIIKNCLLPFCERLVVEQRNIGKSACGGGINNNKDTRTTIMAT